MPTEQVEEIPIARLKEDLTLYPRRRIDSSNIATLVEAYEAFNAGQGEEPPPIIVTQGKTIVDGVHRARAKLRVYGDDATISCIVRRYRSKAEMFYDACMLNSGRGHDLSRWDQLHCIEVAKELNLSMSRLAKALGWTSDRLLSFSEKRASQTLSGKKLHLKSSLLSQKNGPVSREVEAINETPGGVDGMSPAYHARMLLMHFQADSIPYEANLAHRLADLAVAIENWLSTYGAQEAQ
jgi:hypothetical protein